MTRQVFVIAPGTAQGNGAEVGWRGPSHRKPAALGGQVPGALTLFYFGLMATFHVEGVWER